jgi:hypothetical protein
MGSKMILKARPASLGLPQQLIDRIANWVRDYQPIIRLGTEELGTRAEEIEELDQTGIALARELKAHFGHSAKVQYYRAGKLRRILP